MLKIKTFTVNPLEEKCYVISNDNREAVIIDCGASEPNEKQQIAEYIKAENLIPKYILLTHGHFDHILGLPFLHKQYGLAPMLHKGDKIWYEHANEVCISVFGVGLPEAMPELGGFIEEGQVFTIGNDTLKVIHTPGHTQGGVCYYCEKEQLLFSGDTLFCGSVGRSDLEGGNQMQEIESIREKLFTLPEEVVVYPGHGSTTTIGYEKQYNYYAR